ncbi:MAG: glycosyltransferase [Synergistaceae bacterium]|jgi:glycosyltransferase involved in cell wall biosynthesis|nr:glycosyltransferase [Synergistaceae bacterium]
MEAPLISVIVPVYNIEKYIRKCVESIINQTYNNVEIILVDDGSTDGSSAVCDELAESDARVKVFHTTNGGQSVARNVGIKASNGDCIAFVDGDDYVTDDYILHLYKLMKDYHADISITNYRIQRDGAKKPKKKKEPLYALLMNRCEALEMLLYKKYFSTSVCGRLFRRPLLDDVEFFPGKILEDLGFSYKVFDRADRLVYGSTVEYIYVQRATSTLHTQGEAIIKDCAAFAGEMKEYIVCRYPNLTEAAISRCFSSNVFCLKYIPLRKLYREEYANIRTNILKYRKSTLLNAAAPSKTRGAALLSYLGIWFLRAVLAIYNALDPAGV